MTLGLVCIFLSQDVNAQKQPSTEEKNLQTVVVGLFDALAELNVDKAKSFCTPAVTILESGQVWTFDSLALRITTTKEKVADFKRINQFDFIETKIAKEMAWVSYFNDAAITVSGKTIKLKWLETAIFKKTANAWKIDLLHSTELSRTP